MAFLPGQLLQTISDLPTCERLLVAYSGGMDSHVLLHGLIAIRDQLLAEIHAVHVNHGLQSHAQQWAEQCSKFCNQNTIPITVLEIDASSEKGESPEAVARARRYRAISELMQEGDILLTAHHSDDQAETVLLQLLRGSGPSGLAAMPMINGFGPGFHARPLIAYSRADLTEYANQHQLKWVEDFSNSDISFDRNYLRQKIIPLLKERWPSLDRTISRSASHCAEAQQLINDAARIDLENVDINADNSISIDALSALPQPRARAVIRTWVKDAGLQLPDTTRLDRVLLEMLTAREDRNPVVEWPGVELRRYRDRLFVMSSLEPLDADIELEWDGISELTLPSGLGTISVEKSDHGIPADRWDRGEITVSFRTGGERCKPIGREGSKSLKNLFQEQGIPPWQRDRIPLINIDGRLAAVADIWICNESDSTDSEDAIRVRWIKIV
jgi:tRNA(Ile)-lysidine synthase